MRPIAAMYASPRLQILDQAKDGMRGLIHHPSFRRPMTFVASWGGGWEHVSVSCTNRCPTWTEMCIVKNIFWEDEEVAIQYHPAKHDYVNLHPYCLHIWKPISADMPMPPPVLVGW